MMNIGRWGGAFGAMVLAAGIVGCMASGSPAVSDPPIPAPTKTAASDIVDPLDEMTDPNSPYFVASDLSPVAHERAVGPETWDIDVPEGVTDITVVVACSPASEFAVTLAEKWFSGGCGGRFQNSGTIPLPRNTSQTVLDVDVPEDVEYIVVAYPAS